MEHYQVILAYDGSKFKGFQRQANARSVQGAVEDALRMLGWHGKSILAAGRTDSGAHATGQVITFELDWDHPTHDLQLALNDHLPPEVVATSVKRVCASFHPRYDASWRRYLYRIYCLSVRQPLLQPYAWRVWPAVEINELCEAAHLLIGTHDFGAFGTSPQPGGSTLRTVLQADWKPEASYLTFEITAQAFLYHMVRRLVFVQVQIAQAKLPIDYLKQALDYGAAPELPDPIRNTVHRPLVHGLAPAQGLILAEVYYPPDALGSAEGME